MNRTYKALSHPIRRAVLARLRQNPATAGELGARFDVTAPTMSRHFQVLKDAGLITGEKRGTEIIYRFNASVAEELLAAMAALLGDGAERLEAAENRRLKTGNSA